MTTLRVVLVILGIYALVHVATQSLRHAFIIFVEPRTSLLTKLDPGKEQIASSESLDELVDGYKAAKLKLDEWKQGKTGEEIRDHEIRDEEPFLSVQLHRQAIERWESRQKKLYQLHFFWWFGTGCLAAALGCWRYIHPWLATGVFMVAFGEMIYWTTPEFRLWSDNDEFIRLVSWKLIYSAATLVLLILIWIKLVIPVLATKPAQSN